MRYISLEHINPKNCAYNLTEKDKDSDNRTEQNESEKIYAPMAYKYSNVKSHRRDFGDSSQLTNWILDSAATSQMKPEISYFVPGSLVEMDKYSEVAYWNVFTAKYTG